MKKDKAIESTRRFFEDIFHFIDEYEGENPVWDFSDKQGAMKVKSGLKRLILSILPKKLGKLYSEVQHLVVLDISPGQLQAYQLTELRRDGDFIVALEHLIQSTDEGLPNDLNTAALSGQLEKLLSLDGIRSDRPFVENIGSIAARPIIAMRVAIVAVRLARAIKEYDSQQALSLNLLRRDILLGVTGIDLNLEEKAVKRCARDCKKIVCCLRSTRRYRVTCAGEFKTGGDGELQPYMQNCVLMMITGLYCAVGSFAFFCFLCRGSF
jgi:hypothetical protein